mmetsp:Transcript_14156/g.28868  ORF Transcript_14156/g.28868 Transcript_14156/m.28868 type:complete len:208 (+) Transcript_14156:100-723(+)
MPFIQPLLIIAMTVLLMSSTSIKGFSVEPTNKVNQNNPNQSSQLFTPKHQRQSHHRSPPSPLPRTRNPLTILGFDHTPSDFGTIHKAYKTLVKRYHPDVAVGPDATPEERVEANIQFARITAAYRELKRRKDQEVFTYTVCIDGRNVVQSRVIDSEGYRNQRDDPFRVDYGRVISMTEYRERFPRKKMWYEEKKNDYVPRHNGDFGP